MRNIRQILILGLVSIAIHALEQIVLERATSFEYLEENKALFIIGTMFSFIFLMYFIIRRWNNNQKPTFFRTLLIMFFVQVLTIISLTVINVASIVFSADSIFVPDTSAIAIRFNLMDFIAKTSIFAFGLPLIILAILFLIDRRKSSDTNSRQQ
ncbi:MAG: hypothetical protein WAQ28_14840 [Bacteroidia bacterium]